MCLAHFYTSSPISLSPACTSRTCLCVLLFSCIFFSSQLARYAYTLQFRLRVSIAFASEDLEVRVNLRCTRQSIYFCREKKQNATCTYNVIQPTACIRRVFGFLFSALKFCHKQFPKFSSRASVELRNSSSRKLRRSENLFPRRCKVKPPSRFLSQTRVCTSIFAV